MAWLESGYSGNIEDFKSYATCRPWGNYAFTKYGIKVEMIETDVYHAVHDEANDCNNLVYDRISSIIIAVENEYIPKHVFLERFKTLLKGSAITKYDHEHCTERVQSFDFAFKKGYKVTWSAEIDLNPEYVYYEFMHNRLEYMINDLIRLYDPRYETEKDDDDEEEEE